MKTIFKQRGKLLLALCAVLALALTTLIGIGLAKPRTAYAEVKPECTEQLDFSTKGNDTNTYYGYKWMKTADAYDPNTLVLDGLNLNYTGNEAIKLPGDAPSTLFLTRGSVNKIRVSFAGYTDLEAWCISAGNKLTIKGEGSLTIEFASETYNGDRQYTAIYARGGLDFEHEGEINVKTETLTLIGGDYATLAVGETFRNDISYKSGRLTLDAGAFTTDGNPAQYTMFSILPNADNKVDILPGANIGSIRWNANEGAKIRLSNLTATFAEDLDLMAGASKASAEVKTSQDGLDNQQYMRIRRSLLKEQIRIAGTGNADYSDVYSYAWYNEAAPALGYDAKTLVLDGLNMVYDGNAAISLPEGDSTIHLADGTINRIRISQGGYNGNFFRAVHANGSLTFKGGGKLIVEFAPQTVENAQNGDGRFYSAIYGKNGLTFEHTGAVEITTERLEVDYTTNSNTDFRVCETDGAPIRYKSGGFTFNAGVYKDHNKDNEGLYSMFFTGAEEVVPEITGETSSIVWNAYDGARIELSASAVTLGSGLEMTAGADQNNAAVKTNQSELSNQKYMRIGLRSHVHVYTYAVTTKPTAAATGIATGTCADGDGATTTLTLPVLSDAAYTKVSHAATTEKDAYDTYTYSKDNVTLTFDIAHAGTKLPAGSGGTGGGNGGNAGLSGGAIAGIAIGGSVGAVLIVYVLGYFLFFAKGKLAGNFFAAVYKPMNKIFKK